MAQLITPTGGAYSCRGSGAQVRLDDDNYTLREHNTIHGACGSRNDNSSIILDQCRERAAPSAREVWKLRTRRVVLGRDSSLGRYLCISLFLCRNLSRPNSLSNWRDDNRLINQNIEHQNMECLSIRLSDEVEPDRSDTTATSSVPKRTSLPGRILLGMGIPLCILERFLQINRWWDCSSQLLICRCPPDSRTYFTKLFEGRQLWVRRS